MATLLNLFLKLLGNWKLTAIIIAFSVAVSGYAGWKVRDLFADHAEKSRLEAIIKAKDTAALIMNDKSKQLELDLSKKRAYTRSLENLISHEINKNDVYKKCFVPASGIKIINASIKESH